MTAEIISVGTEILLGQIVDTNAAFLAQTLAGLGINLYTKTVVGDNERRLAAAIRLALDRSDLVILGGGLGPTKDDLTKETAAVALGVRLVKDEEADRRLRAFFVARGIEMPASNAKQALVFEGGTVFQNENGTAPGVAIRKDGKVVACLPGPPHEMKPMATNQLVPYLQEILGPDHPILFSRVLKLTGIGESLAADRISDLLDSENPTVAPYAKTGEVHLRITARAKADEGRAMVEAMQARVAERLGQYISAVDDETLKSVLVKRLRGRGLTLGGAESCTGGQVGDRITAIAGVSDVFMGSAVTYSNQAKMDILGVSSETLTAHGAVSEETAREMAAGARRIYRSGVGFAVTGIAGPDGGSEEKPVGLVYVAVDGPDGARVSRHNFRGGRDAIRRYATQAVLHLMLQSLEGPPVS